MLLGYQLTFFSDLARYPQFEIYRGQIVALAEPSFSDGTDVPEPATSERLSIELVFQIFITTSSVDHARYPRFEIYRGQIVALAETWDSEDAIVEAPVYPSLVWPFSQGSSTSSDVATLSFPHFQPDSTSQLAWPYFSAADNTVQIELDGSYPAVCPCA